MSRRRCQVGIIGAGPAGLLLSQLLSLHDIETVVLERRSQAYVEGRIRAGVLETGTVELIDEAQAGARMHAQGLVHKGIEISVDETLHRIDFDDLVGASVMVYGQTEITKDLNAKRLASGADLVFEADDVAIHDLDTDSPRLTYAHGGEAHEVVCDFVCGCDGFHGVSRTCIPDRLLKTFERVYPFAWLGILSEVAPISEELIYAYHERGYALFSMRSPRLSRLYLQCAPDEDLDAWPDARVWEELALRLGGDAAQRLAPAPSIEKSITPMRSFVAEPMRHGRLFLAGDAAHIVPPTGAKGLNLAASDVRILRDALVTLYADGDAHGLDTYSERCLSRVWKAQRFSWWMTSLLHTFPEHSDYQARVQRAELDYVTSSRAAATSLAENYVGLPFD